MRFKLLKYIYGVCNYVSCEWMSVKLESELRQTPFSILFNACVSSFISFMTQLCPQTRRRPSQLGSVRRPHWEQRDGSVQGEVPGLDVQGWRQRGSGFRDGSDAGSHHIQIWCGTCNFQTLKPVCLQLLHCLCKTIDVKSISRSISFIKFPAW